MPSRLSAHLWAKYYCFGLRVRARSAFRRYDFCHAVDAMSLFAARGFAARGVPVLLDVNEIPDPFERQGARFTAASDREKRALARAFSRDLPASRAMIATSEAMADFVAERFGRDAVTIRNARATLSAPPSAAIRDDSGAGNDGRVIVYPCTAAPHLGVEAAIETLCRLPESYRLVFVGRFVTPAYRETVERLIRRRGVGHRVYLKGELPDQDYLPYLAGADIGLVPLTFAYRNQQVILPWRVVDLAAALVPIVATPSEAMRRVARDADIGEIAASANPDALAASILTLAAAPPERLAAIRATLGFMAENFSPTLQAERYRAVLATLATRRSGRAAFAVNLALRHNRRLVSFIDEVCALGWRVDLYCVRAPDRTQFRHSDMIRFVEISDRILPRVLRRLMLPSMPDLAAPFLGLWFGLRQWRRVARFAGALREAFRRHGTWDIVIATDLFALPAGLAGPAKSFLVYDATEIPDLRQRTSPLLRRIPAPLLLVFRRWERAYVRRAGLILAPSRALAGYLRLRYRGRTRGAVVAVRNAGESGDVAIPSLRDRLGLPASDIVLVSPCGISVETGATVAARALRFLPPDHVLVFIGRFSNARAEAAIRAVLRRDRTEHRCFFVGEAEYGIYLRWLSEADLGLVLFDPGIANMRLAAPNRFFDLLAARVPTVATEIDDVAAILRRTRIGAVLRDRRPATVARTVLELRARLGIARGGIIDPASRERIDRVAALHQASTERARLVASLTRRVGDLRGKRVALLTLRSAFSNRRFRFIAAALQEAGASVAGFDTDIGRAAPPPAQPDWLTTIPIR